MRAIRVESLGGPEVLTWAELPVPEPEPRQVLVKIAGAGVNFIDVYHRTGLYPLDLPITLGLEGAGTVEAVGEDVNELAIGDRVAWADAIGSYAEYSTVAADRAVFVPDDVGLDLAAAVLLQGITAHYLSHDTYPVGQGEWCLIHAGAGGVGRLLIQMAKMLGATVITTASTQEKAQIAQKAGADHVIVHTEQDFVAAVEELTGEKALAVVYDGVGADTLELGLKLLRRRGMMVAYGNASGRPPRIDPLLLSRLGSLYLTRPTIFDYIATREELERRTSDLFRWIVNGDLDVLIGARFPLRQATEAHRALEGRSTVGKVLLEV